VRSADEKVIIASMLTAHARILTLLDAEAKQKRDWGQKFKQKLSGHISEIAENWSSIEEEIVNAISAVGFGNTRELATALSLIRREVSHYVNSELKSEEYLRQAIFVLHEIFDKEFGYANERNERVNLQMREGVLKLVDKAVRTIEEMRTVENAEDFVDEF